MIVFCESFPESFPDSFRILSESFPNCTDEITQYALKGQKLLAQGTALGLLAVNKAPCKGKSFVYCLVLEGFCPYRAAALHP